MYDKNSMTGKLNQLFEESGLSQDKFAKKCGLSLAALKNFLTGRTPNTESLLKICQACSVSADWLLGLSDVREPSADLRAVCEYTGLSEKAVETLRADGNGMQQTKADSLSDLIETSQFINLLIEYDYFLDTLENMTVEDLKEMVPYSGADGKIELGRNATALFFRNNIVSQMGSICNDKYEKAIADISKGSLIFYSSGDGRKIGLDKSTIEQMNKNHHKNPNGNGDIAEVEIETEE